MSIHPPKTHTDGGFVWPQAVGVNDDGLNLPALVAQGDDLTGAIFRHSNTFEESTIGSGSEDS
jgi:hypothetical protein